MLKQPEGELAVILFEECCHTLEIEPNFQCRDAIVRREAMAGERLKYEPVAVAAVAMDQGR
jgi:hypothetical protein